MKKDLKQIENFLDELSLKKNISNSTMLAYEKDLNDYVKHMQEKNVDIFEIKEEEFKEYFETLKNSFKLASIKRKYSSVKNFYKYLWKNKLVSKIFEYNFEINNLEKKENLLNSEIKNNFDYDYFLNSLEDNLYDTRIKVISMLIAELNMNLVNIFEIQIRDLLKYNFKKIVINRNNKIFDYDLSKNMENALKDYYEKYAFEKRFLFSTYNIQAFRNDLKKYNLSLADLKMALAEDEESMYENIKKIYFEIGIGDK